MLLSATIFRNIVHIEGNIALRIKVEKVPGEVED